MAQSGHCTRGRDGAAGMARPGWRGHATLLLRSWPGIGMMLSLAENDGLSGSRSRFIEVVSERYDAIKEVDDANETLHNLTSLLLTNKTIRTTQQGSTEFKFFNNKQSISVGV